MILFSRFFNLCIDKKCTDNKKQFCRLEHFINFTVFLFILFILKLIILILLYFSLTFKSIHNLRVKSIIIVKAKRDFL